MVKEKILWFKGNAGDTSQASDMCMLELPYNKDFTAKSWDEYKRGAVVMINGRRYIILRRVEFEGKGANVYCKFDARTREERRRHGKPTR